MSDPKFKQGDTVKLKSGSPAMTVVKVMTKPDPTSATLSSFKGTYLCSWFVDTKLSDKVEFPEDALELNG
jgi:uncharacterized protein YodC (DUF2158 family)